MQGSLSIERMCQLAKVSRAGFYRLLKETLPRQEDTEVRSAIQQVALEHRRRYGYRRVTAELKRRGMQVNHKRVARTVEFRQAGSRPAHGYLSWVALGRPPCIPGALGESADPLTSIQNMNLARR